MLAIPVWPLGCKNWEKAAPSSLTFHSPSHNHREDSERHAEQIGILAEEGHHLSEAEPEEWQSQAQSLGLSAS